MTVLRMDDVVPWSEQRPAGTQRARRTRSPLFSGAASRRAFLKGLGASGAGVGLAAIGALKFSRPAGADGYDMAPGDYCPSAVGGPGRDCNPCCGPSPSCFGTSQCCTSSHWFKTTGIYSLRPNQCGGYDGWKWQVTSPGGGACGVCSGVYYTCKCHDGWKNGNDPWICNWGYCGTA